MVSACYTILVPLLVFLQVSPKCEAKRLPVCAPTSCGSLRNISYPFRLNTDPKNCGDRLYELVCENNTPILNLSGGMLHLNAIDYQNHTIRVTYAGVGKNNCSFLQVHSGAPGSGFHPFQLRSGFDITLVRCERAVFSPLYVETAPCTNGSSSSQMHYSYAIVPNLSKYWDSISDLKDSCSIDRRFVITFLQDKVDGLRAITSFSEIHNALVYGLELFWDLKFCQFCPSRCNIDEGAHEFLGCHSLYGCDIETAFVGILNGWDGWDGWTQITGISQSWCRLTQVVWPYFSWVIVVIAIWLSVGKIAVGIPCTFAFLIYKFRKRHSSMYDTVEDFLRNQSNLVPIRYSYSEIKKMTNSFNNILGEGGYGSVFKGKLRSGQLVAVKILSNKSKANGQDFINEVATIGRIHHVNVVRLVGFCAERSKRALVYDFMENGSLEKYLFSCERNTSLSCEKMYEISIGVARGIEYLHRGCNMQILHFDIKPHNILLDKNFTPKVSDFGLAKLNSTNDSIVALTAARGTLGYIAPELFYKNIGDVSYKADVYSFGMLLMEMGGKRKNLNAHVENSSQVYFPSWVYSQLNDGKDIEIGDANNEERTLVKKMIIVACWCIQTNPTDRPSMKKVVQMLETSNELQEMPPNPFISPVNPHVVDHEISRNSIKLSILSGR